MMVLMDIDPCVLADAQDLLMLILPDVFIFAVAHELPPVIRLILFILFFLVGEKKGLCRSGLSCLVYSEKVRSFLVL